MDKRNDDNAQAPSAPDIPPDVPEGDALDQSQEWVPEPGEVEPVIPPDAPEADVLEQQRPADLDDDGHDR